MHKYGCTDFNETLRLAYFSASEDTEDFEDKSLTQRYQYYSNCLDDSMENEPLFSKIEIED